ncbi:MAG TPA: type II secretion system protein N [Rhizomicrobium sp.]|nr:type II secretion system protein N [Rhizomicrobium sp.]
MLLEAALAIALAVQGVRLFWMIVTPTGAFGPEPASAPTPVKADLAVLSRFDPFFRGVPDGGASAGYFTLFGVRMAAGGRSTAILGTPDGRQDSFALGQSIAPGVVLAAVERDHVVLTRGGVRTHVGFQASAPTAYVPLPSPAPVAQAEQGGTIAPKDFLAQTSFEPRLQGNQVLGYTVSPRDGGKILAAAGLQPGDVIRAINGAALSRHRFGEIESEFSGATQVELTIERGGQTITRKLQVAK